MDLLKFLKCVGVMTLMASLVIIVRDVDELLTKTGETVQSSQQLLVESQRRIKDLSQNANAILLQVGIAADNARRASESQEVYNNRLTQILDKTEDVVVAASEAIRHTDRNINDVVLTQVSTSLKTTDALTVEATKAITESNDNLQKVLVRTAKTIDDVDLLIASQDIPDTLHNIKTSTGNLTLATEQVTQIAEHVNNSSARIEEAVTRSTRPATFAVKVGTTILGSMSSIGNFIRAIWK